MKAKLNIDVFAEGSEERCLGQVTAIFDAEAMCEPCVDSWEVGRGDEITPRLERRPLPGAYRYTSPIGREEVLCLGHIEDDEYLEVCP